MKITNDTKLKKFIVGTVYISYKLIHSDKTIGVDLDKFDSGENNILLVCGLSGSGKTTIGKKLSKLYNCFYISLDKFWWDVVGADNDNWKNLTPEDISIINKKITQAAIKKIGNRRGIIEGIQIYIGDDNFIEQNLKNHSVIFIGSSAFKSAFGLMRRDMISVNFFHALKNMFIKNPKWSRSLQYHRGIRASLPSATVVEIDPKYLS